MQDYQLRQRDYLLEISRAMTSRLDLESLLELSLKSAVEILRGHAGLIVLPGRDGVLQVRASHGLPTSLFRFFQPLWADLPGLRDLYEVSCEELDLMAALAQSQSSCWGARMTGAGFGGCIVALVERDALSSFARTVVSLYERQTMRTPALYACQPSPGAGPVS